MKTTDGPMIGPDCEFYDSKRKWCGAVGENGEPGHGCQFKNACFKLLRSERVVSRQSRPSLIYESIQKKEDFVLWFPREKMLGEFTYLGDDMWKVEFTED